MDPNDLVVEVRLMAEENMPDQETVLSHVARLEAQRRRLTRGVVLAGTLTIAGACVAGTLHILQPAGSTPQAGLVPPGATSTNGQNVAGCAPLTLGLRRLVSNGQTLAEATGQLTGRARTIAGLRYSEMRLTEVQVIAGARLSTTSTVWLRSAPNPSPSDVPGLWAMNGRLIAIVTPEKVSQSPVGPIARVAPVLGKKAVLSAAGCWTDTSLNSEPLSKEPFRQVPGTPAYDLALKYGGFSTIPITALAKATR